MPRAAIASEIEIEAPPALVWQVLTDLPAYPEWNPFTVEVESELQPGADVVMQVVLKPGRPPRRQVERVAAVEPERLLCWGVKFGFEAVLVAERCQTLEPLNDGRGTRYRTVDTLSGLLLPVVMRLYGVPMQRGFDGVAKGLKQRAEQLASS